MASRLAHEVAEASRALVSELPVVIYRKPTHANVLVDIAKKLQRLQTKAKRQRRELAATLAEIKIAKRELRAVAQAIGKDT
jgi:hypothetical protein